MIVASYLHLRGNTTALSIVLLKQIGNFKEIKFAYDN